MRLVSGLVAAPTVRPVPRARRRAGTQRASVPHSAARLQLSQAALFWAGSGYWDHGLLLLGDRLYRAVFAATLLPLSSFGLGEQASLAGGVMLARKAWRGLRSLGTSLRGLLTSLGLAWLALVALSTLSTLTGLW